MEDYKTVYYALFNKVTDIISQLQEIQKCCEEICIREENHKIDFEKAKDVDV